MIKTCCNGNCNQGRNCPNRKPGRLIAFLRAVRRWEFRGRKLNPPHVIVIRTVVWVPFQLGRIISAGSLLLGGMTDEAKEFWEISK